MKKKLLAGLAVGVMMFGMAGMAQALTMADVGGNVDNLIAQANLGNSGADTELTWMNQALFDLGLGNGYEWEFKQDTIAGNWQVITDPPQGHSGVFAYDMPDTPEYFMIKTANAQTGNTNTHFLFDNLVSVDWAVISLGDMGFTDNNILKIGKVSHIGGVDNNQPVPEPATMLLMGTGLAGLAAAQRRRKAKKS